MENLKLLKKMYYESVDRCNKSKKLDAWHFEKHFTQVILEEIVPLIDYSYVDTLHNIEKHFGVQLES